MTQTIQHSKVYAPSGFLSHIVYFVDDENRIITYKSRSPARCREKGKFLPLMNGRNVSRRCAADRLRTIKAEGRPAP